MKNEFKISDILNAVNSISNTKRKKSKNLVRKELTNKDEVLTPNKQGKYNKSEILVLNQMIE